MRNKTLLGILNLFSREFPLFPQVYHVYLEFVLEFCMSSPIRSIILWTEDLSYPKMFIILFVHRRFEGVEAQEG
jgi:hypothetical protein